MKWFSLLFFVSILFGGEPVDVVIPCAPKDQKTLDWCIDGIRKNGIDVRRIIVVSKERLTDQAEWYDEFEFPFTVKDAGRGWIFQQLLKLYAPIQIPDISRNVLILDSDVIFMRPVQFVNEAGQGLFSVGNEYEKRYFRHMAELIPGLKRIDPKISGIAHHMLFQRECIEEMFEKIRQEHGCEPWEAIMRLIPSHEPDACTISEYELYFTYVMNQTDRGVIRPLRWKDSKFVHAFEMDQKKGYDYVAYHTWMREPHTLVFVHLGDRLPVYAKQAIKQARRFNPSCEIVLIANRAALKQVILPKLTKIIVEELDRSKAHQEFLTKTKLDQASRDGFWVKTMERFFILDEAMKKYKMEDVIHLEYDNMVYTDFKTYLPTFRGYKTGLAAPFDADKRCIPSCVYIKSHDVLHSLIEYINAGADEGLFDMFALAKYRNETGKIDPLPLTPEEGGESVFDAAALGQYLGGIDPRNGPSRIGFVNETCYFDPSNYQFLWEKDEQGRFVPYMINKKGIKSRINNLHIHSKNLISFASKEGLFPEGKYVTEKTLRFHADYIIDSNQPIYEVARVATPCTYYVEGEEGMKVFMTEILPKIHHPAILFTSAQEDLSLKYPKLLRHRKLAHWYGTNLSTRSRKIHLLTPKTKVSAFLKEIKSKIYR